MELGATGYYLKTQHLHVVLNVSLTYDEPVKYCAQSQLYCIDCSRLPSFSEPPPTYCRQSLMSRRALPVERFIVVGLPVTSDLFSF